MSKLGLKIRNFTSEVDNIRGEIKSLNISLKDKILCVKENVDERCSYKAEPQGLYLKKFLYQHLYQQILAIFAG